MLIPWNKPIVSCSKESTLAALFRGIVIREIGMSEDRFISLISKYVDKTTPKTQSKEISSIKGNVHKEYMKSHMTWRVFLRAFKILSLPGFSVTMKLRFKEGNVKEVSVGRNVILQEGYTVDERDVKDPDTALYKLYNDVQMAVGMDVHMFNRLFNRYALGTRIPLNMKDISSARGNLNKELKKSTMSWKVFMKGLSFLSAEEVEFGIHVILYNGKLKSHYLKVLIENDIDLLGDDDGK
jgi:hypothetical protein